MPRKSKSSSQKTIKKRSRASPKRAARKTKTASGPKVRLVLARGDDQGKSFTLIQGENLIGRWDPDQGAFPEVDLEQDDVEAKVSRRHAVINLHGSKVSLTDMGSLNGTFVNRGARLSPDVATELKTGDEIIVGKTFLRLEISNK